MILGKNQWKLILNPMKEIDKSKKKSEQNQRFKKSTEGNWV